MRTSPCPTSGSGASRISSTSGPPLRVTQTCFISRLLAFAVPVDLTIQSPWRRSLKGAGHRARGGTNMACALSPEQQQLQQRVARFCAEHLAPPDVEALDHTT